MKSIELLAPAKNKEIGMAAILAGADAIYIGAERFGARSAATNSKKDIIDLCAFAHKFGARVYVTINTVVNNDELQEAYALIDELADVSGNVEERVDALLLQDLALVDYARGKIEIHASTQMDNRSIEQVKWLRSMGFGRVVLARELSLKEIETISGEVSNIELEAFVHGALCVCYSGQCYASEMYFKRSANRGECCQVCRMKYTLQNADGGIVADGLHLLSLKDMCRLDDVEQLLEAGVTSLKIEGRLKDVDYVKNVVAAYSNKINSIIKKHPAKYKRNSFGRCSYSFLPNVSKSFNRGFTNYFLHSRNSDIFQPYTPKSVGEHIGKVKDLFKLSFTISAPSPLHNGDGVCFFDAEKNLVGFRVNNVKGNMVVPYKMPKELHRGTILFRNYDHVFVNTLQLSSAAIRKIPINIILKSDNQLKLTVKLVEEDIEITKNYDIELEKAIKSQRENQIKQLSKLGDTVFCANEIIIDSSVEDNFIPASILSRMRRETIELLEKEISKYVEHKRQISMRVSNDELSASANKQTISEIRGEYYRLYPHLYNIYNERARSILESQMSQDMNTPVTLNKKNSSTVKLHQTKLLMQCKHCLRYSFGKCPKYFKSTVASTTLDDKWKEPLKLVLDNGRSFNIEFDCKYCQMNLYADK